MSRNLTSRSAAFLVLALAPVLMAPTCMQKSVYPMPSAACTPAQPFHPACQVPEQKLVETESNAVIALGLPDWSNLEVCTPCSGGVCFPRWGYEIHNNCVGNAPCECTYFLDALRGYLWQHVTPNFQHEARSYMIQLAPVFSAARKTPLYLNDEPWDSPAMKQAYHKMLDQVLVLVAQLRLVAPAAPVTIGFGNEVNMYLNRLNPDQTERSEQERLQEWAQYKDFVRDAQAYLESRDPLVYGTVTTTWVGDCGYGDWLRNPVGGQPCHPWGGLSLDLALETDLLTFTYYPRHLLPWEATPQDMRAAVALDFGLMNAGAQAALKPILLQEIGYPSPTPGTATQHDFLEAAFSEWSKYYVNIWGMSYFSLHDFDGHIWGLYDEDGNVKDANTWNNFVTRMKQVP